MAASKATVVQSLSIALIVFVMLTFILAVMTYLFFKYKLEAETAAQAAEAKMAEANQAQQAAEQDKAKLKQLLGFADVEKVDEIETKVNEEFAKKFGDFKEDQKAYSGLSKWLLDSMKAKDETIQALNAEKAKLIEESKQAQDDAARNRSEMEAQVKAKEDEAANIKKQFDEDRARYEEIAKKLSEEHKVALERAERLKLLGEEVAKAEPLLPPTRQAKFKTQEPEARVGLVLEELRERERVIARQNAVLAQLRVADKELQDTVLAATPQDDRIDGFDGRILTVNEADGSVLIDFGSTGGLRTGLVLRVYAPGEDRPLFSGNKAVVEVVAVESDAIARARIRNDSIADPILAGDLVATSLWSPRMPLEAVIVGFPQLDSDLKPDPERLQAFVERIGGRVEQNVTTSTTMLIDAGLPKIVPGAEKVAGWRPADETRRKKQLDEAKRLGIRVVGIDGFLDMLGVDRSAIEASRLVRPGERGPLPAGAAGLAY